MQLRCIEWRVPLRHHTAFETLLLIALFTVLFQLLHVEQMLKFPEQICASLGPLRYTQYS